MAGERKGKTYEALVMVALQELKRKGRLRGEIFWNRTPVGMTIEPDFTVGANENNPRLILLVTHSGSAGDSHKKFWRNMGELAEAKTLLPTNPRVCSIAFDSMIKEDLKKLQAAAFDGQLIVGDKEYGRQLQRWVDGNASRLPTEDRAKAEAIREAVAKKPGDDKLKELATALVADIGPLLESSQPELDHLWMMERRRDAGKAPSARDTFLRRGLSKLLIFEDVDLALKLYRGAGVRLDEVPVYAFQLGLAKRTIRGVAGADREVQDAVAIMSDAQIKTIVKAAPIRELEGWLQTLRNQPHLTFMGEYAGNEFGKLVKADELTRRLAKLHDDPWALVPRRGIPARWPPATVWLLEYLIEVLKAASRSVNGYGYAQLAREIADSRGPAASIERRYREYLLSPWGHLSEWIHRVSDRDLPVEVIRAVALVISSKLFTLGENLVRRICVDLPAVIAQNILETKIVTYRGFDPVFLLLASALRGVQLHRVRGCFAERAGLGGQAGKTEVLQTQSTIINWQSAHGSHTNDKKKELAGRAVALRYSWDSRARKFMPRTDVKKLLLVVDGTWRQEDLDSLARAG